jgi:hypothetical protein
MAFLSRYAGTSKIDLTDLADDDGTEYWVTIKKTLTADESDRAEDARVSATNITPAAGRAARAAAARRRAGRPAPGDEDVVKTLLNFNSAAYKRALVEAGVVDWNLTDEHGQVLPLRPPEAKSRSIAALPAVVRNRIFEAIEDTTTASERTEDEDADFRDRLPDGGGLRADGSPADPGPVGAGGVLHQDWSDAGGGDRDL